MRYIIFLKMVINSSDSVVSFVPMARLSSHWLVISAQWAHVASGCLIGRSSGRRLGRPHDIGSIGHSDWSR